MKLERGMALRTEAIAAAESTEAATSSLRAPAIERLDALFVLNSLTIGGSETKVVRACNELHRRGTRVGVAYLNPPETLRSHLSADIPVFHLERKGKFSFTALALLRRIVRERKPHTLIAVSLYPTLYVNVVARSAELRPKTSALINTSSFNPGQEWQRTFYGAMLRGMDWTVYGCEAQRKLWQSPAAERRNRASVIYNGVDVHRFSKASAMPQTICRGSLGIGENAFVIGSVGRLAPEKNQAALIDALAQLRQRSGSAHLVLVGDGPMRAALQARCNETGLQPFVTFAGNQADVRPWLALMDAFVLPSLYVETFSNAALEAMAMSKPVVLSNIAGAAEMIEEGAEGFLVEPRELSARLPQLLERLAADAALRSTMGTRARARVEEHFSFERMVDSYDDLIRRLAADDDRV